MASLTRGRPAVRAVQGSKEDERDAFGQRIQSTFANDSEAMPLRIGHTADMLSTSNLKE